MISQSSFAIRKNNKSPIPEIPVIRPISVEFALRLRAYIGIIKFIIPTAIPELMFMSMNLKISSLPSKNFMRQSLESRYIAI